jgi:uncharacterized membrane protein
VFTNVSGGNSMTSVRPMNFMIKHLFILCARCLEHTQSQVELVILSWLHVLLYYSKTNPYTILNNMPYLYSDTIDVVF